MSSHFDIRSIPSVNLHTNHYHGWSMSEVQPILFLGLQGCGFVSFFFLTLCSEPTFKKWHDTKKIQVRSSQTTLNRRINRLKSAITCIYVWLGEKSLRKIIWSIQVLIRIHRDGVRNASGGLSASHVAKSYGLFWNGVLCKHRSVAAPIFFVLVLMSPVLTTDEYCWL